MRRPIAIAVACLAGTLAAGAQAPPKQASAEPKTTWYFYTVKWGLQDEFLDLFQRNHDPILKAKEKAGMHWDVPLNRLDLDARKPTR